MKRHTLNTILLRIASLAIITCAASPEATAFGAELSSTTIRQPAAIIWTFDLQGDLTRASFSQETGKLIVHGFEGGDRGKPVHHVINASGKEDFSGAGFVERLTPDGKHLIGSFGVKDLDRGSLLTNEYFTWSAYRTVKVSPSGRYLAVLPNYYAGDSPYEPFLKIYTNNGGLVKDFSGMVAGPVKEDLLNNEFHGAFVSDTQFVIHLRTLRKGSLILIDIPTGAMLWEAPAPRVLVTRPKIQASKENIIAHYFSSGKGSTESLCGYSFQGNQKWCIHENYSPRFLLVDQAAGIAATIYAQEWGPDGRPLYGKWRSQLINANTGKVAWEKQYFGEPLHFSVHDNLIVALARDAVNFVTLDGMIARSLTLPKELTQGGREAWRERSFYVEDRNILIAVKGGKIYGVGLALEQ